MSRRAAFRPLLLLAAVLCSLALTAVTITSPAVPTDWARLDNEGIYIPSLANHPWVSYTLQVALWLAMIAALWWGCGANLRLKTKSVSSLRQSFPISMVLITLLGFGLRLYTLNRLPLIVDEIGFAAHASDILHGQAVPIFAPGHNANPSVYSWLVAGAMALFGQNRFAIRLIPLVFGTLTIPAACLLGRIWYSKRVGLLAAAFLATYPAHVFYSRLSLYNIVDPFFAMLALACLAKGINRLSATHTHVEKGLTPSHKTTLACRRSFVAAGLAAGIAQYFYHGSRLLPLLIAVYIGLALWQHYKMQAHKGGMTCLSPSLCAFAALRLCVESCWLFAAFVLVALPRYAPMLAGHLPLTGNREAMRLPADLGANTLRALLAWVGQPDVSPFWLSDQPLLLLPALLAALLGIVCCLRRWRDARAFVLLLALLLTTIFGGAIWTAAPLYVRYITALPGIVLLVALGIEKVFFDSASGRGRAKPLPYIGLIFMLIIALQGIDVSLFVHPRQAEAAIVPGHWEEDALAMQAAHLPPGTAAVLLVSPDFGTHPYDGPLQMMSVADDIAAYGERRVVIVNQRDPNRLNRQLLRLGSTPYALLTAAN